MVLESDDEENKTNLMILKSLIAHKASDGDSQQPSRPMIYQNSARKNEQAIKKSNTAAVTNVKDKNYYQKQYDDMMANGGGQYFPDRYEQGNENYLKNDSVKRKKKRKLWNGNNSIANLHSQYASNKNLRKGVANHSQSRANFNKKSSMGVKRGNETTQQQDYEENANVAFSPNRRASVVSVYQQNDQSHDYYNTKNKNNNNNTPINQKIITKSPRESSSHIKPILTYKRTSNMINTSNIDHSVNSSIQNPHFKAQNQYNSREQLEQNHKLTSNLPQIRKSVHHTRNQTNQQLKNGGGIRQHSEMERTSSHHPTPPNKLRKSPSFTNVASSQQASTQLVKKFIKTPTNAQSHNIKYFAKSSQQKRGKTPNTKSRQQAELTKKISTQQSFAYQQINQSLDKNVIKKASSVQSHQVNKLASANQLISPRYEDGSSKHLDDDILHQQKSALISDNLQIPSAVKRVGGPGGITGLQNMKKSLLVQNSVTAGYSQPHQRASTNLSNGGVMQPNYSARPKQTSQQLGQQLNEQQRALYGDRSATGYIKVDLLGKGGCALVWLGQDIEKRQDMVAMKQFPKNPPKGSSSMLMMNKVDLSSYRTQLAIGSYLFQSGKFDEHRGLNNISKFIRAVQDPKDYWLITQLGGKPLSKLLFQLKGQFYNSQ